MEQKSTKTKGIYSYRKKYLVDNQRGRHDEFVFTFYRVTKEDTKPTYKPIRSLHNTAWQRVRREVGLDDLHVHDLRHTVGMRLRMAGVAESFGFGKTDTDASGKWLTKKVTVNLPLTKKAS